MTLDELKQLRGLVATVCISGTVDPAYSDAREEMRSWHEANGFTNIEYITQHAVLVESGRDAVVQHALQQGYDWVLQIDADAAPFAPQSLVRLMEVAYKPGGPDVIGAYAQLKGPPHLPTIDTGTGTWELHYPGEGVLPVMRTGAHFLLCKTDVFRAFGPPWFRTRMPIGPLHALRDVDNFSRIVNDGNNSLAGEKWDALMQEAMEQQGPRFGHPVGEDSSFCDTVRALGFNIAVHCDIVVGHVAKKVIQPQDLIDAINKRDDMYRAGLGLA